MQPNAQVGSFLPFSANINPLCSIALSLPCSSGIKSNNLPSFLIFQSCNRISMRRYTMTICLILAVLVVLVRFVVLCDLILILVPLFPLLFSYTFLIAEPIKKD